MIAAAAAVGKSYERGRTPVARHEGCPMSTQEFQGSPPSDPPVPNERDGLNAPVVRHEGRSVHLYGHLGAGLALSEGPGAPSELVSLAKTTSGNTANVTTTSGVVTKVTTTTTMAVPSLRTAIAPVTIVSPWVQSSTTHCVPGQPYYRR